MEKYSSNWYYTEIRCYEINDQRKRKHKTFKHKQQQTTQTQGFKYTE